MADEPNNNQPGTALDTDPAQPAPSEEPEQLPDAPAQEKTYTEAEYNALQQELDKLRKEHLSKEEQTRLELTRRETDVANREAVIRDKENRLHAIQALEQAQLVGGGIASADLIPFVMDSTTNGIDKKVKALSALLEKRAKAETDKIYHDAGRQPHQVRNEGTGGNAPIFSAVNAQAQSRAKEIRERYTGGKR